jgi:hypothetical protein
MGVSGMAGEGDEAATIAELLTRALRMTEKVANGALEVEGIDVMLAERMVLIDAATVARERGDAWGARETALVQQLQEMDAAMVANIWSQRQDSFDWLAKRSPDAVKDMPLLRGLAESSQRE